MPVSQFSPLHYSTVPLLTSPTFIKNNFLFLLTSWFIFLLNCSYLSYLLKYKYPLIFLLFIFLSFHISFFHNSLPCYRRIIHAATSLSSAILLHRPIISSLDSSCPHLKSNKLLLHYQPLPASLVLTFAIHPWLHLILLSNYPHFSGSIHPFLFFYLCSYHLNFTQPYIMILNVSSKLSYRLYIITTLQHNSLYEH